MPRYPYAYVLGLLADSWRVFAKKLIELFVKIVGDDILVHLLEDRFVTQVVCFDDPLNVAMYIFFKQLSYHFVSLKVKCIEIESPIVVVIFEPAKQRELLRVGAREKHHGRSVLYAVLQVV